MKFGGYLTKFKDGNLHVYESAAEYKIYGPDYVFTRDDLKTIQELLNGRGPVIFGVRITWSNLDVINVGCTKVTRAQVEKLNHEWPRR